MNVLLWVIQGVLALLCLAGGATKVFKFDDLAKVPPANALSRGTWRVLGLIEMAGAVLLIVPAATSLMPVLTPLAAIVLAVENLGLSMLNGRHSLKLTAANPLVWSAVMALLALLVAYGRYALSPVV